MSRRHVLGSDVPQVFGNDGAAIEDLVLLTLAHLVQFGIEHRSRVVDRVANNEAQVDQMMRVAEIREKHEMMRQMRGCILQWRKDQYPFVSGSCDAVCFWRLGVEVPLRDCGRSANPAIDLFL